MCSTESLRLDPACFVFSDSVFFKPFPKCFVKKKYKINIYIYMFEEALWVTFQKPLVKGWTWLPIWPWSFYLIRQALMWRRRCWTRMATSTFVDQHVRCLRTSTQPWRRLHGVWRWYSEGVGPGGCGFEGEALPWHGFCFSPEAALV